jgi:alpha-beta hydrolase superfamily lysophospholipase
VTAPGRVTATATAAVDVASPTGETTSVVIVLSGGKANSFDLADARKLAAVRMRPFASVLHRRGRRRGVAVWTLRYRYRGWNGEQRSPVADVQWALDEVRRRHGDLPVVLVGHSMGGRAALAGGGDPLVRGVCALAPWTMPADPFDQLAGREVLIVHGTRDIVTSPRGSRAYARHAAAAGARVGYIALPGEMHAMLFRWRTWHRLAAGFALGVLGVAPTPSEVEAAFATEL